MSGGGGNFGSGSFRPSTDQEITCENLNIALSIIRPDFSVFDTQELNGIRRLCCTNLSVKAFSAI